MAAESAGCPKCGDTLCGYVYEMTETHVMVGAWGEGAEAGGTNWVARQSLVKCAACGALFQFSALERKGCFG